MFCHKCGVEQSKDNKFCSNCGASFGASDNPNNLRGSNGGDKKNKRSTLRNILLSLLTPPAFLFVIVSIWGLVNLLSETFESESMLFSIVNAFVPILVGLSVLAMPVGIVFAIYFYLRRNEN